VVDFVVVAVTGRCNLACRYCYGLGNVRNQGDMSWETAAKILNYLKKQTNNECHPVVVQFTGGEPLLNFALIEKMIKASREENLPIIFQIQTNATLLTPQIVTQLKEWKIGIGVSLDGIPSVNDAMRPSRDGSPSTLQVVRGIELLKEEGLYVNITTVLTRESLAQLDKLIDMAYYLGNVKGISFNVMRPIGGAGNIPVLSEQEVARKVKSAVRRAQMHKDLTGHRLNFKFVERVKKYGKKIECACFRGRAIFVDTGGRVYPCPSLAGQEKFLMGNIEEESFHAKQYSSVCPYLHQCRMLDRIAG